MDNIKIYNVELNEKNNKLNQYKVILDRFDNWTQYNREIKLNTLLEEGKRIEFKVYDISRSTALYIELRKGNDGTFDILLQNSCAIIDSLTFIINGSYIEKMELGVKILRTESGKTLQSLLEDGCEVKVSQHIKDDIVYHFYISY